MRTLLLAILGAVAVWYYANQFGLEAGFPPWTPVFYWDQSSQFRTSLRTAGTTGFVAVDLNGNLSQGSLEVVVSRTDNNFAILQRQYTRKFSDQIRVSVDPGVYDVTYKIINARGTIRYDWFAARRDY